MEKFKNCLSNSSYNPIKHFHKFRFQTHLELKWYIKSAMHYYTIANVWDITTKPHNEILLSNKKLLIQFPFCFFSLTNEDLLCQLGMM